MTALFPPFNRRASFRKLPYFYEAGRGPHVRSQGGPSLNLNFANMTSGAELAAKGVTFSRNSNATYYDSTGKLTYAPNNLGLWSNDGSKQAAGQWVVDGTTFSNSTGTLPDGSQGQVNRITLASPGNFYPRMGVTLIGGTNYIVSAWVRSFGNNPSTLKPAIFDGSTWQTGSTVTLTTEWQRIYFKATQLSTSANGGGFYLSGAVGQGIEWCWAQLEAVTYQTTPGPYNPTTSAAYYGPRFDYDPVTLQPKGLLTEEARTNLAVNSGDFTTSSYIKGGLSITRSGTGPDGVSNSLNFITEDTSTGSHYFFGTGMSLTAGVTYTVSVFVKPGTQRYISLRGENTAASTYPWITFDTQTLAINATANVISSGYQNVGNGIYRIWLTWLTFANVTGNAVLAGSNVSTAPNVGSTVGNSYTGTSQTWYAWGLQLEAGSFATSYIPTAASSVARAADLASMTGTNFSSWYNQSEGTFIADGAVEGSATTPAIMGVDDGTSSNRIVLRNDLLTPLVRYVSSSGNYSASGGSWPANIFNKLGFAYKASDQGAAFAGTGISVTPQSAVPTVNQLQIGNGNTSLAWNGWIKSITYYRQRLSNAQLQRLTQ